MVEPVSVGSGSASEGGGRVGEWWPEAGGTAGTADVVGVSETGGSNLLLSSPNDDPAASDSYGDDVLAQGAQIRLATSAVPLTAAIETAATVAADASAITASDC